MPKRESDTVKVSRDSSRTTIIVAIITLIGTLLVAYWQFGPGSGETPTPPAPVGETEYIGRVLDADTLQPVANAKITLDLVGVPPIVYTDSEGVYRFQVSLSSSVSGQVRVDAQGYQVYQRNITIAPDARTLEDIRLTK